MHTRRGFLTRTTVPAPHTHKLHVRGSYYGRRLGVSLTKCRDRFCRADFRASL